MSDYDFVDRIKSKMLATGKVTPEEIVGCTEKEIEDLMVFQNIDYLPEDYRAYLSKLGKSSGVFSKMLKLEYDRLDDYKDYFEKTISRYWPELNLPEKFFVFSSHLGYSYSCIVYGDIGTEVICYIMGDENIIWKLNSFEDWLIEDLPEELK